MVNHKEIDIYFSQTGKNTARAPRDKIALRSRAVKLIELIFPSLAAVLLGLLIIIPNYKKSQDTFKVDITMPKTGELEKLHIESTDFYITDRNNKVNNFTADNIDETSPGSKLIKLTNPRGIIPADNGTWYNIEAPVGYYDQNQNTLRLEQNASVIYSDGLEAHTQQISYDFKTGTGLSTTPTSADGWLGSLTSQGLKFFNREKLIIFTGKTHISIDEKQLKEQSPS